MITKRRKASPPDLSKGPPALDRPPSPAFPDVPGPHEPSKGAPLTKGGC